MRTAGRRNNNNKMIKHSIYFVLSLFLVVSTSKRRHNHEDLPICDIGAGYESGQMDDIEVEEARSVFRAYITKMYHFVP